MHWLSGEAPMDVDNAGSAAEFGDLGDPAGTDPADRDAHGSSTQRSEAFTDGCLSLGACHLGYAVPPAVPGWGA
jgi:hypothetical protein